MARLAPRSDCWPWDRHRFGDARRASGWRLYGRFALAGMIANLLAFGARFLTAWLAHDPPGSRGASMNWTWALFSFALCGVLTGLIGAAMCFRASSDIASPPRNAAT